jgi:VWFA-related protein
MRLSVGIGILLTSAVALAQEPPSFPTGADVVILDMTVNDQRGRLVPDLRPDEVQVFEDGVRCEVTSFRLVQAEAAIEGTRAAVDANSVVTPRAGSRPEAPRLSTLVVLVFDPLSLVPAQNARRAALDFLARPFPAGTWFAVFKIGAGLRVLQPFTDDPRRASDAIAAATRGGDQTVDPPHDPRFESATEEALRAALGGGRSGGAQGASAADGAMSGAMADMLRSADLLVREEKGRASLYPLLALAKALASTSGRKTLLFFSEGLNVPPDAQQLLEVTVGQANRANISVYALDARGLSPRSPNENARMGMELLERTSESAVGAPAGAGIGGGGSMLEQMKFGETLQDTLRLNLQGNLNDLAESTGGILIANTNDLRPGLERIATDLRNHYEVAYVPPSSSPDGRFRRIKVQVARQGVTVRTRRGYFALPPGSPAVLPYELPLLGALQAPEPPHGVAMRTGALQFTPGRGGRQAVVLVEVPLAGATFERDEAAKTYHVRLSLLAQVRDAQGRLQQRLSHDWPLDGPLDQAESARGGNAVFKRTVWLAPGRYSLEAAVQDRGSGQLGVQRRTFDVSGGAGLAMSSVSIVRRTEAAPEGAPADDPLRLAGASIVPNLGSPVVPVANPELSLFMTVYPAAGPEPVEATLEFRRDDRTVGRARPELPSADDQGRIAYVGSFPADRFPPGTYEVRATVRQGVNVVDDHAVFEIARGAREAGQPATPAPPVPALTDSELVPLLDRAGRYVAEYEETFRNLVSEELYTQWTRNVERSAGGSTTRRRITRADLVFVTLPGNIPWASFRDVYEVDGNKVREHDARLEKLFREAPTTAVERASVFLRESARYNLGTAVRTLNVPTIPLLFLHPRNQARFAFKRGGRRRIFGVEGLEIEFVEKQRPTLVKDGSRGDLPATGRFWIDADRGIVLRSEAQFHFEPNLALASVMAEYRPEPGLAIWVPVEMKERYEDVPEAYPSVFGPTTEATARYSNYRRFTVSSEVTATVPEESPQPSPP